MVPRRDETQGQILERLLEYGRQAIKNYPVENRFNEYRRRIERLPISGVLKQIGLERWERIVRERRGQ